MKSKLIRLSSYLARLGHIKESNFINKFAAYSEEDLVENFGYVYLSLFPWGLEDEDADRIWMILDEASKSMTEDQILDFDSIEDLADALKDKARHSESIESISYPKIIKKNLVNDEYVDGLILEMDIVFEEDGPLNYVELLIEKNIMDDGAAEIIITSINIDEKYRGKGFGKLIALMATNIACKEYNAKYMLTHTFYHGVVSQAFQRTLKSLESSGVLNKASFNKNKKYLLNTFKKRNLFDKDFFKDINEIIDGAEGRLKLYFESELKEYKEKYNKLEKDGMLYKFKFIRNHNFKKFTLDEISNYLYNGINGPESYFDVFISLLDYTNKKNDYHQDYMNIYTINCEVIENQIFSLKEKLYKSNKIV